MSLQLVNNILTVPQDGIEYVFNFEGTYVGVHVEVVDCTHQMADVDLGTLDCYCVTEEDPLTILVCNRNGYDVVSVADLVDDNGVMKQLLVDAGLYASLLAYGDTSEH